MTPKPPKELICCECGTRDPEEFKNIYYIPEGGQLTPGWLIICTICRECVEATLMGLAK